MKLMKRILMTAVILIASTACAYASMDDKSDRMSSSQSNTFSPGYINATMQKTQGIIRQAEYGKSPAEDIEKKNEVADDKLSNKVAENAATRVTPELKKKTGGGEARNTNSGATTATTIPTIPGLISNPVDQNPPANIGEIVVPRLSEDAQNAINTYANDVNGHSVTLTSGYSLVLWSQWDYDGKSPALYNSYYTVFDDNGSSLTENARMSQGLGELIDLFAGSADDVHLLSNGFFESEFKSHDITLSSGNTIVSWTQYDQDGSTPAYHNYFSLLDTANWDPNWDKENVLVDSQLMESGLGDLLGSGAVSSIEDVQKLSSEFAADMNVQSLTLTNGNTVLLWGNGNTSDYYYSSYFALIGSNGNIISNNQLVTGEQISTSDNYALDVGSGYFAVVSRSGGALACGFSRTDREYSTLKVYDSGADTILAENDVWTYSLNGQRSITISESGKYITNVAVPASGRLTVYYNNGDIVGNDIPGVYVPTSLNVSGSLFSNIPPSSSDWQNRLLLAGNEYNVYGTSPLQSYSAASSRALNLGDVSGIMKDIKLSMTTQKNEAGVGRLVDYIFESALAVPRIGVIEGRGQEVQIALALANILKNPTGDQKLILDTMQALLAETEKSVAQSPEVKKASDDLLQVVANILIAQAMPDLLKEGDMSNIKGIFQDMNTQKEKIMMEYNLAVEPYYKEVKKLLAKNLALLQLNNIVSKTMVEDELNKMEPNEINKLLAKLHKASNKSSEEEYVLQEEIRLRSKYIDPNKKAFEEKMKAMLEGFTQRLSKILETTKK